MPQAVPYNKVNNFTQFATNNPAAPYNPAFLDSELNGVSTFANQIQTNLAIIQRDDGRIKSGVVDPDALSLATLILIAGSGSFNPRGLWVTSTIYAKGDMVTFGQSIYITVLAYTSDVFATDLAANRVMLVGLISTLATQINYTGNGGIISAGTLEATNLQVQGFIVALQTLTTSHAASITSINSSVAALVAEDVALNTLYTALDTYVFQVRPFFDARPNNLNQNIVSGVNTKVNFGFMPLGLGAGYNTATSRFTPVVAGFYRFSASLRLSATNRILCSLDFFKNGVQFRRCDAAITAATNDIQILNGDVIMYLDGILDYVEVFCSITGTSPRLDFSNATNCCNFTGHLVQFP